MCGRYALWDVVDDLKERFTADSEENKTPITYNAAPSQPLPIVTRQSPNSLTLAHWGIIPPWAKEPKTSFATINAKAETLLEKPLYNRLVGKRRCLVPANGFYEWKLAKGGKQPHFIKVKDEKTFAFAGLYDKWESERGDLIYSFTIITCDSNSQMRPIHNRMPVILRRGDEDIWINTDAEKQSAMALLGPYTGQLELWPVSRAVNNPRNNSSDLVTPEK